MLSERFGALVALHITVIVWSFASILGKLISYSSITLTWHRFVITTCIYLVFPSFWRDVYNLSAAQISIFIGIGIIVCSEFVLFYESIKLGDSASITLVSFSSISFFASILEPALLQTRFSALESCLGVVIIIGLLFIYLSLPGDSQKNLTTNPKLAILTGICAAFLASLFSVLNKKYSGMSTTLVMSTLEMGTGALLLSIAVPLIYKEKTQWYPDVDIHNLKLNTVRDGPWDLIWVFTLAVICTNFAFYLFNLSLKHLSAFNVNLITNLEPLYGLVLGSIIFHEDRQLNKEFYIGTAVILSTIFLGPLLITYISPEASETESVNDREFEMNEAGMPRLFDGRDMTISDGSKRIIYGLPSSQTHSYEQLHVSDSVDDDTNELKCVNNNTFL